MRFAIITPTTGRDSLRSALNSVKSQTCGSYIHLVIGDGPQTEHVKCWCKDSNVRYLELSVSGKCYGSFARNLGLEIVEREALADYVVFLDDDNILLPTTLERYEKAIREKGNPALLCQKVIFRNQFNDRWLELPRSLPPEKADWDSLNGCYRADIIKGHRWECDYNHDFLLAEKIRNESKEEFVLVEGFAGVHF